MPAPGPHIPVVLGPGAERRRAERFAAAMPVRVEGQDGTTQDLSTSGLSFLAPQPHAIGARIEVVIEYLLDGHNYPLRCEAEVVRVEPAGSAFRIGARLAPQSRLQDVAPPGEDGAQPHLRVV